tara:strand:+ start:1821 stop:2057 length:237 start_codon:yes stop_codon:yes gene_type:complete
MARRKGNHMNEDFLDKVNCGAIVDCLDSAFDELGNKEAIPRFTAYCLVEQAHLMAVAASALQRIAASLERIEDNGIPH